MSLERNNCPKCQGNIRIVRDRYGSYFSCIQCGYHRDVPQVQWGRRPSRARSNPFMSEAKKLADKRWRREQPPLL